MNNKKILRNIEATPMTDADIKDVFIEGGLNFTPRFINYLDLEDYNDINDLLDKNKRDCIFILYPVMEPRNNGHWTLLMRDGDIFYFFDSYGGAVDAQLSYQAYKPQYKKKLLTNLLKGYKVVHNRTQYQQDGADKQTCGRWATFFAYCWMEGMGFYQIKKILDMIHRKTPYSFDEIISGLINDF
jgi:hypothetical protein